MTISDTLRNIRQWTNANRDFTARDARRSWASSEIVWGVFELPEREVRALGDVAGLRVLDMGCGTGYFCAWLTRRGAGVVGLDVTPAQLATALALQASFRVRFPLILASAEQAPLASGSFDLVLSEHGASAWCDPRSWVAEAARLLRPGGRLVFLHTSPLADICFPDEGRLSSSLQRPYFVLGRGEGEGGVEYQLTHAAWIDVLRGNGLRIERLIELQAPPTAAAHPYYSDFDPNWARSWPAEEIWVATREAGS